MSNVPCPNVACSNKKLKRGDVDQFGYDGFSCLKCGGEYSFPYSIGYFDGASDEKSKIDKELQSLKDQLGATEKGFWKMKGLIKKLVTEKLKVEKENIFLKQDLEKAEKVIEEFKDIGSLTGMELEYKARVYFQEKQEQLKGDICQEK